jgi:hypothetical protein
MDEERGAERIFSSIFQDASLIIPCQTQKALELRVK